MGNETQMNKGERCNSGQAKEGGALILSNSQVSEGGRGGEGGGGNHYYSWEWERGSCKGRGR